MKREYPVARKNVEVVIKSEEERIIEGQEVTKLMKEEIIIPERAGLVYHIISMKWWSKWLSYTKQTPISAIENFKSDTLSTASQQIGENMNSAYQEPVSDS